MNTRVMSADVGESLLLSSSSCSRITMNQTTRLHIPNDHSLNNRCVILLADVSTDLSVCFASWNQSSHLPVSLSYPLTCLNIFRCFSNFPANKIILNCIMSLLTLDSISVRARDISQFHSVRPGSGANPPSYPMGTMSSFTRTKTTEV
jgi:hypothetical protein